MADFKPPKSKIPTKFGGDDEQGLSTLLGYMFGQQKAQEAKSKLPNNATPIEGTVDGIKYQTPEAISLRKYTKEDIGTLTASDAFTRSKNFIIGAMDKDPVKFRESFAKANVNIPGLTQPQTRGNIKGYPTTYGDELGINIQRELDNMSDLLLRLRSGAQINEGEYQRLRGLMPTYKDISVEVGENGETFPTIRRSLTQFESDLSVAKQRAMKGGYYDAGFWENQQESTQQSPIPGMSNDSNSDQERKMALDAIAKGAPEAKVRDRYRSRTGREL